MAGKMYFQTDGKEEFRWFLSDSGEVIYIGQHYAGSWIPAARVSTKEARVTKVMPLCKSSPLLFDIVGGLCAACEKRLMAA